MGWACTGEHVLRISHIAIELTVTKTEEGRCSVAAVASSKSPTSCRRA